MKKVMKTIVMLFVASGLVLTSCGDDDTDVKDVELTMIPSAGSGTHFVQDTLKLTINGKGNSDNKLKSFTVTKAITGNATTTVVTQKLNSTDFVYNFMDTLEFSEVGTITYTFKLEGEKGAVQTKTYVATVNEIKFIDVTTSDVSLFAQQYDGPNFMNLRTFETYGKDVSAADLENSVDIASYFGTSNRYTLSSPSDPVMQGLYSGLSSFWTTGKARTTGLYKATGQINFNTVAASGIDKDLVIFANGKTYAQTITTLALNDVILFKTKDSKLGLIKITGLSPANPQSDNARFDFQVLVQK